MNMQAKYALKVQAIRSKGQQPRLYVYFPLPLAAAIGLQAGEEVQWELLDRGELHLTRSHVPAPRAKRRSPPASTRSPKTITIQPAL
ncbi:MAG: hypothetical protein AAB403_09580 [Planctomycetota bacterium]